MGAAPESNDPKVRAMIEFQKRQQRLGIGSHTIVGKALDGKFDEAGKDLGTWLGGGKPAELPGAPPPAMDLTDDLIQRARKQQLGALKIGRTRKSTFLSGPLGDGTAMGG